jgi:hypothetical protein
LSGTARNGLLAIAGLLVFAALVSTRLRQGQEKTAV